MKNFFLTAFTLVCAFTYAQEFTLGKVSEAELKQVSHTLEPEAPAAILYRKGSTYFDFDKNGSWEVITEVSVRLKIYNKSGYGFATVDVPVSGVGNTGEKVEFSEMVTYNLEGGKIIKTRLKDESKIAGTAKSASVAVTLPNIKEGSVIEYRYLIRSPFFTTLPKWYFQYSIPVNNIEYAVHIPEYFLYTGVLSPYFNVTGNVITKKRTHTYANKNPRGGISTASAAIQNVDGSIIFDETRKTYIAANVPSLTDEIYVDNIDNYRSSVEHELVNTHFPKTGKKEYATTWATLAELVYSEKGFGDQLLAKGYFEKDIDALVAESKNKAEVVEGIYKYVRDRMTWNGGYGYSTSQKLSTAYEQKSGDIASINLMLISMLRHAGIKANPVILSTRENGQVSFVNRNEYNYVIAGIESQQGIQLLDATSKISVPGVLPLRALGGVGRIIRDNFTSDDVPLMPMKPSLNNTAVTAVISSNATVRGKIKAHHFDYSAYEYREKAGGKASGDMVNGIKKAGNFSVHGYKLDDKDLANPVIEEFEYSAEGVNEIKNGKIYISPMLMFTDTKNPFNNSKRSYPVDFVYPHQDKYSFNITIPEGYAIESLPEAAAYQMKDGIASFKFSISAVGKDQVQVVVVNNINYAVVGPDHYAALKEYYGNVVKKQSENIVLKKI